MEEHHHCDKFKQKDDTKFERYFSTDYERRADDERRLRRISKGPNKTLVEDRRMAFVCPHKFFDNVKINCALRDLEAGRTQEQTTLIMEGEVNKALDHELGSSIWD